MHEAARMLRAKECSVRELWDACATAARERNPELNAYLELFDADGRMLLQRRAAVKTRFALRWANSCCGHPAPGQDLAAEARARLIDEMGIGEGIDLSDVGSFVYQASDAATGRVEYEWDHVLVGRADGADVRPNPAEVGEYEWVAPRDLAAALVRDPDAYSPWLPLVLRTLGQPVA